MKIDITNHTRYLVNPYIYICRSPKANKQRGTFNLADRLELMDEGVNTAFYCCVHPAL